jgi:hypothetical protein
MCPSHLARLLLLESLALPDAELARLLAEPDRPLE